MENTNECKKYLPLSPEASWKDILNEYFDIECYPDLTNEDKKLWKENIYKSLRYNLDTYVEIEMTNDPSDDDMKYTFINPKITHEQVIDIIRELFKELGYKYFITINRKVVDTECNILRGGGRTYTLNKSYNYYIVVSVLHF